MDLRPDLRTGSGVLNSDAPAGPETLRIASFARRKAALAAAAAALAFLVWLVSGCARKAPPPLPPLPDDEVLVPDSLRGEPAVLLSDSAWWRVLAGADGNRLERRAVSWYRVNRRDPPVLERIHFHENDMLQAPGRFTVEAWYPDRGRWRVSEADLERFRPRPEGLYLEPGGSFRTAIIPGYGEGVLIRVETREVFLRPEFRSQEFLRGSRSCLRRFVSFRAPEGHGFRIALRNREGLAVAVDTARPEGDIEIRLGARDLPRILPDRAPRYSEDWYAALHFSIPPKGMASLTWRELGDHYLGMLKANLEASPAVRAAAAGLAAGGEDSLSDRAFRLVKSRVRYLGDFRGLHAWVPRSPQSVWDNGYGDCKEMANLLRSLLAEKGVEGGLALVRAGDGPQLREEFPSLGAFDHALYWRRRADGSAAFLDPTMPGELGASSYLHVLGQKVLLLRAGASAVDTVRPAPGFADRIATASALEPGDGGAWRLRGTIALSGKVAQDLWLSLHFEPDRDRSRARVLAFLAGRFGLQARELSWTAPAPDTLEIRYVQDADGMSGPDRRSWQIALPRIFAACAGPESREGEWRTAAFSQSDTWTLPEGYPRLRGRALEGRPARGAWSLDGGRLRREFAQDPSIFPPGDAESRRGCRESLDRFSIATVSR